MQHFWYRENFAQGFTGSTVQRKRQTMSDSQEMELSKFTTYLCETLRDAT